MKITLQGLGPVVYTYLLSRFPMTITQPSHTTFMHRCLALARQASQKGNTPVGAIVVRNGAIIAEAEETLPEGVNIAGHAEILAIQQACEIIGARNLSDCILYSTAEPCWMCAYAIRDSRIHTVVLGALVGEIGSIAGKFPILTDAAIRQWEQPPHIIRGVLEAECESIRE